MARMPNTEWIGPTSNRTAGGMIEVHGLVLHVQQGSEAGSEAWFKNVESQASAHFLNPKSGRLQQLVDTADRAWAQAAGNPYWISVENEGVAPAYLTASQVDNVAQLLAWLHQAYAVPIVTSMDTMGRGLAYHGMGGAAWGNHPGCPGAGILGQRGGILTRAQDLVPPPAVSVSLDHVVVASLHDPGAAQGHTTYPADVRPVEAALRAEGLLATTYASDGSFGTTTVAAYGRWQKSPLGGGYKGGDADGIPGLVSLTRLGARHGWAVRA